MSTGRLAGWLALGIACAAAAGVLLPLEPWPLDLSIDMSFGATLHQAAGGRLADGPRLISTYGPLGFLFYPLYLPETFPWLVGLRLVLAAVTCWALAWIGSSSLRSPWGAALAVAATTPMLAAPDVWFQVVPLLALLIELAPGGAAPRSLRIALGAAIGLSSLVKFTFFLGALAVLVPHAFHELALRRRPPLVALAAAAVAALTWIAMGMSWADWVAFLVWSLREITPGYSAAMQLHTSWVLIAHAAATSVAVVVAGALLARQRIGRAWWTVAASLAGVHFLMFKAGYVRPDAHVYITASGLLVVGALLVFLLGPPAKRFLTGALVFVLLGGGMWWHTERGEIVGALTFLFRPVLPIEALGRLAALPDLLPGGAVARGYEPALAEMRKQVPIEAMPGPVDVYPCYQNLALAYGLDFRPRPVFQSYMAYTPRLMGANAAFLDGAQAPESILFQVRPLDNRFPALEDAASWPTLLTSYTSSSRALAREVRGPGIDETFIVLSRRKTPLAWRLEPIRTLQISSGSPVPIPEAESGPVWVRIDLQETAADRLVTTALAAPLVLMFVNFGGTTQRYRLIPAIARDGFLLSPAVRSTHDFLQLLRPNPRLRQPAAIQSIQLRVVSPLGGVALTRTAEVEFSRLVIEREPPGR